MQANKARAGRLRPGCHLWLQTGVRGDGGTRTRTCCPRHHGSGGAARARSLLEVPHLGTGCGVSESEEAIIKALVSLLHTFTSFKKSLACTLLWRERGGKGDQRKQVPTLPLREAGTHAASATVSFIYGAARQQAECASAAGPLLAL